MPGDAWDADVTLDTVSITGTRDGLPDASPKVTESPSSSEVGKAHYMAKGDRLATLETDRMVRDTPFYLTRVGIVQLESGLRSKDSRVVRRRVVGKVPIEATRWRPTLLQARFGGGSGETGP